MKKIFSMIGKTAVIVMLILSICVACFGGGETLQRKGLAFGSLGLSWTTGVEHVSYTISTAALGTVRTIYGEITASNAAISGGTIAGVRGLATLSGSITAGGAYIYGAQGKLAITGTMNHADSRLCGLIAQLDTFGRHVYGRAA